MDLTEAEDIKKRWQEYIEKLHTKMPGASVRNSALGKSHEEGGFSIRKGRIEPQETPCSHPSTPKTSLPTLLLYALTFTSDFTVGCHPPPLSEKELTCSYSR